MSTRHVCALLMGGSDSFVMDDVKLKDVNLVVDKTRSSNKAKMFMRGGRSNQCHWSFDPSCAEGSLVHIFGVPAGSCGSLTVLQVSPALNYWKWTGRYQVVKGSTWHGCTATNHGTPWAGLSSLQSMCGVVWCILTELCVATTELCASPVWRISGFETAV